jgi:hypothetical protein
MWAEYTARLSKSEENLHLVEEPLVSEIRQRRQMEELKQRKEMEEVDLDTTDEYLECDRE